MNRIIVCVAAVLVSAVVLLGLAPATYAQQPETKKAATKLDRISGTVQDVNKDKSTIVVRQRSTQVNRTVVYSPETKITTMNKPGGAIEELKQGTRIICLGKFDKEGHLVASRIDIR